MKCREGAGRGGGEKRRISRRPNYIISPQIQIDGRKKKGQKEVKYPSAIFHLVQSRRAAIHSIPLHTNPAGSVPRLPPALYMVLLCASDFSAALANVAVANVPGRLNFFCCWGRVCGGGGGARNALIQRRTKRSAVQDASLSPWEKLFIPAWILWRDDGSSDPLPSPRLQFLATSEALPEGEERLARLFPPPPPPPAAARLTEAMLFCLTQLCYVC